MGGWGGSSRSRQCVRDDVVAELRSETDVAAGRNDEVLLVVRPQLVRDRSGVQAGGKVEGREHLTALRIVRAQMEIPRAGMEHEAAGSDEQWSIREDSAHRADLPGRHL